MNSKQILIVRTDLNMRKGKIAAQAAHASTSWLTRDLHIAKSWNDKPTFCHLLISPVERHWLENSFRKICVGVNSEEELLQIHNTAQEKGLKSFLITDSGLTEFHGVPTNTCCAIGPDWEDRIDEVCSHLTLL